MDCTLKTTGLIFLAMVLTSYRSLSVLSQEGFVDEGRCIV